MEEAVAPPSRKRKGEQPNKEEKRQRERETENDVRLLWKDDCWGDTARPRRPMRNVLLDMWSGVSSQTKPSTLAASQGVTTLSSFLRRMRGSLCSIRIKAAFATRAGKAFLLAVLQCAQEHAPRLELSMTRGSLGEHEAIRATLGRCVTLDELRLHMLGAMLSDVVLTLARLSP